MPRVARGNVTLVDMNDIVVSPTEPTNPTPDMIWMDSSSAPYHFYRYNATTLKFEPTGYTSLQELDATAAQQVTDAYNGVISLNSDEKLTRFERSLVRGQLADITGVYLAAASAMPTLAEIDTNAQGAVYALRKQSVDLGLPTNDAAYTRLGTAYTALRTYLSGLTPKAWDIDSTATNTIVKADWEAAWNEYLLAYNGLRVVNNVRSKAYSEEQAEQATRDAIAAVSNSVDHDSANLSVPLVINAPISTLGLPQFSGRHVDSWAGGAVSFDKGERYTPVFNPIFSAGTSIAIRASFYGDGTNNDEFYWDTTGNAVKLQKWDDKMLDGTLAWEFALDGTGYKQVRVPSFSGRTPVSDSVAGVKYNGDKLSTLLSNMTAADQIILGTDNVLTIGVADTDSGWGETYQPLPDEIKAYFNGWRMCNGTFGTAYAGTGTKTWYPIGDLDLARATASLPVEEAVTISEFTINNYQVLFRYQDAVAQVVDYDGILQLIQGDNNVTVRYPETSPTINTGVIKYATNLATVTKDLAYLIPTMQKRISNAEEIITDDSIVNKVVNSVEYKMSMSSKADVDTLSGYAPAGQVDSLSEAVNGLEETVNNIDLTPFVTQSELEQTSRDITAKFGATGGMNLVRNSIGFANLDFWQPTGIVETISNNELDMLGFGSGFVYRTSVSEKMIEQTINVDPGRPYTLSWYLKKLTSGADASYRFRIEILETVTGSDGIPSSTITTQLADNSGQVSTAYAAQHMTFTPQAGDITIRFAGNANVEAILTGVMLTIGDVPLQWSLATGEVYNTNIRMDINGIRVSRFEPDPSDPETDPLKKRKIEIGYTEISPDEFAGYYTDGEGGYNKIFYLNGEETVSKKFRAQEEITMGRIKAISVNGGWAFISNIDD